MWWAMSRSPCRYICEKNDTIDWKSNSILIIIWNHLGILSQQIVSSSKNFLPIASQLTKIICKWWSNFCLILRVRLTHIWMKKLFEIIFFWLLIYFRDRSTLYLQHGQIQVHLHLMILSYYLHQGSALDLDLAVQVHSVLVDLLLPLVKGENIEQNLI